MFCIPPLINRKLKKAVEDGVLNPEKLLSMTPEERVAKFQEIAGEKYAEQINKRFASKFNVELHKSVTDDIIESMAKINAERAKAPRMSATEYENTIIKNKGNAPEWARQYAYLQARIDSAVNPRNTLGVFDTAKAGLKEGIQSISQQDTSTGKAVQALKVGGQILFSPVYKSLKASMDLSYALRQGFKVFLQSPKEYGKAMTEAFQFVKKVGNREEMDKLMSEFKAAYYAHPNYEKLVDEGKLSFGIVEDWFPTSVAEKIPALGNIFKASNDAFTVFSQSARFGIANNMLQKFEKEMLAKNPLYEVTKEDLKSIAYVANSITGRGSLGRLESIAGHLNKLFFSARYISSQLDVFAMPFNSKLTLFARKEALINSAKVLSTIGALMTTASFFTEVETDPRSSRFGKMKVGDNWIDLTSGIGSYIVLAARQATGETKSTITGKITKLNSGKFGAPTRTDVAINWFEGKLAPGPSTVNQVLGKGELFGGQKATPVNIARQLVVPISFDNTFLSGGYMDQKDKATALISTVAEILGANVSQPSKR